MKPRHVAFFLTFFTFISVSVIAQNLSFSVPINLLPNAVTNKAVDITLFNGRYFITWTDSQTGGIHVAYLGDKYQHLAVEHDYLIKEAQSGFAPVLRKTPTRLYLIWIGTDGSIKYTFNSSETGFNDSQVYTLAINNMSPLTQGITSAINGDKITITSHSNSKDGMVYALAKIGTDGQLTCNGLKKIPGKSAAYPFVASLSDSVIRITYRGYRDEGIYYADCNINNDEWTKQKQLYKVQSGVSPAIFKVYDSGKLFYVWRGGKKETRLYYTTEELGKLRLAESPLPGYFATQSPVSICDVDKSKSILAYVGLDNKCYISYFSNYNPAKWMEETFYPAKANYNLKDIAIPGAHDAGMSVLTAAGGQQAGTINECNTLTQVKNVTGQLNSGIRMFDLRIGIYKNALYTKHCASDCMEDAIGGGYGEKFSSILLGIKGFLAANNKETVILSFSHFCEKEAPAAKVAQFILDTLGRNMVFANGGKKLADIPLSQLAGKVVVVFEQYASADKMIDSCSIAKSSKCFINFKREYAATNILDNLLLKEKTFFTGITGKLNDNDLVRLDWQLTQSSDEAAMVCNDFQDENLNPLINGVMALTSVIRNHRSIRDLSVIGNRSIPVAVNEWMDKRIINKNNKPNILYVDVANNWITDYCIQVNMREIYTR